MAHIERLRIYPVKSLDGIDLDAAQVTPRGTLDGDREYALFDESDDPVNGVRTTKVHEVATAFDPGTHELTIRVKATGEERRFDLARGRTAAEEWFGEFFGIPISIERRADGFPDRPGAGPSVISTATLEEIASWFPDATVDGVRRRLRANVEVGGVPAFWEDRFVDGSGFTAGEVRIDGVEPCGRCAVPMRDPDTGERDPDFRRRFIEKRRETFPGWADESAFDHYYQVMLIAQVPEADRGKTLRVRDPVSVGDS